MSPPDVYSEKHHILPRSLGGDDHPDNIVSLTAREHFIVHLLLTKFTNGQDRYKMMFAFHALSHLKSGDRKDNYYNSRLYDMNKKDMSIACSKRTKRNWECDEYREKMINAHLNSWANGSRDEQRERMRENSPLKDIKVHEKSMRTRKENGSNIFETNNPMKDKTRAFEIASKRSGNNHYSKLGHKYFYRDVEISEEWIPIDTSLVKFREKHGISRHTMKKMINGLATDHQFEMKRETPNEN